MWRTNCYRPNMFPPTSLPLCMDLLAIHRVAAVQGTQVTLYRQLAVHHRVL